MPFGPDRLSAVLNNLPRTGRYWVAYSGGLDSQVLLHAMARLRGRLPADLRAIHIDHGLHSDAGLWRAHCERYCTVDRIPLTTARVQVRAVKGQSLEALAREARYRVIRANLAAGDMLLTAHHRDDQAETVLLQLLRGSGPGGLAGMPLVNRFDPGWLCRPLLAVGRVQLLQYARSAGLRWVDDASNLDTGFDRNFLRHRVMPLLRSRWPALDTTLCRSARHCGEAQSLIDAQAVNDLLSVTTDRKHVLSVSALRTLPPPRRRALLRYWFRELRLPVPDTVHLERIGREVLAAARDRMPRVGWSGAEVRRYRDGLYALSVAVAHDPTHRLPWQGGGRLPLPAALGCLTRAAGTGRGIAARLWAESQVTVGFRTGGERCRPGGRGHTQGLKKLFQARGIPPWERDRIPLLFLDDRLAAVVGFWVCEPFRAAEGEPGYEVVWSRPAGQASAEACDGRR